MVEIPGGSDSVFHAPQNLEKGGHGVSPRTMHHLKSFFPGLESVLFRTLFLRCRVPDKFPCCGHTKMTNLCADDADFGLTPDGWILIYALSLVLSMCVTRGILKVTG